MSRSKRKPTRPSKISNIGVLIRQLAEDGNLYLSQHAYLRHQERFISREEAVFVLATGYHVPSRDEWKLQHDTWNYCVEGKTLDDRKLRVIVAIESEGMLIVTLIDLDAKD